MCQWFNLFIDFSKVFENVSDLGEGVDINGPESGKAPGKRARGGSPFLPKKTTAVAYALRFLVVKMVGSKENFRTLL